MQANLHISLATIVVPDYDEAIEYFVNTLGFHLREDTPINDDKRWVVVAPSVDAAHAILLAKAANETQRATIGNQTGGRVAFFLETDDFAATYDAYRERGVEFTEGPREESYGIVAVFRDRFGNRWDLIERRGT